MRRPTKFERGLREVHGPAAFIEVMPVQRRGFLAGWTPPQKAGLWALALLGTAVFGLLSLAALGFGGMVLWAALTAPMR